LACKDRPSCPGVSARLGIVVVMVLCPHCNMVCHNATVPVMVALLALYWFASCPVQCELTLPFVIVSCPSGGISMGVGSHFHVVGCPAGREASDHNPKPRGRGPVRLVGLESQSRSCEPHPTVGGTICPSRRAVIGWWVTVPVVTTWRCCLVWLHGVRMVFVWSQRIAVPSVLVE
jgi:hypothetical protein